MFRLSCSFSAQVALQCCALTLPRTTKVPAVWMYLRSLSHGVKCWDVDSKTFWYLCWHITHFTRCCFITPCLNQTCWFATLVHTTPGYRSILRQHFSHNAIWARFPTLVWAIWISALSPLISVFSLNPVATSALLIAEGWWLNNVWLQPSARIMVWEWLLEPEWLRLLVCFDT